MNESHAQVATFLAIGGLIYLAIWALARRIVRKAGYSGWWALLFVVLPYVALPLFALRRWPVEREVVRLRVLAGLAQTADFERLIDDIVTAEKRGDWYEAVHLIEVLLAHCDDKSLRAYATELLQELRQRIGKLPVPDNPYVSPRSRTIS